MPHDCRRYIHIPCTVRTNIFTKDFAHSKISVLCWRCFGFVCTYKCHKTYFFSVAFFFFRHSSAGRRESRQNCYNNVQFSCATRRWMCVTGIATGEEQAEETVHSSFSTNACKRIRNNFVGEKTTMTLCIVVVWLFAKMIMH